MLFSKTHLYLSSWYDKIYKVDMIQDYVINKILDTFEELPEFEVVEKVDLIFKEIENEFFRCNKK